MHKASEAAVLLEGLDLGQSIAELDTLLETARVETSAFADLYQDKVDLIPGTKGSGKSALFRIFVDFLPGHLLKSRKASLRTAFKSMGTTCFTRSSTSSRISRKRNSLDFGAFISRHWHRTVCKGGAVPRSTQRCYAGNRRIPA